mmetsp:Transcript_19741/g.43147  ORF Transcript_19741/g.43147 Transcript_19741/m.43147 type:complete len:422 (-) Transcript_19741:358-1623(-)
MLIVPEESLLCAAVKEASECNLEKFLGHAWAGTFLVFKCDAERPSQLAVAPALEAFQDVLEKKTWCSPDLDMQRNDSAHLQLDLLPDVTEEADPSKAHRNKVVVSEERAEVCSQPELVHVKDLRNLGAGVIPPPLPLRNGLTLVDPLKNEVIVLNLGSASILLVQSHSVAWQRVRRVEELQEAHRVPELLVRLDVFYILNVDNLGIDHIDHHANESLEHVCGPLEGKLICEVFPVVGREVQDLVSNSVHHGYDPCEPVVPAFTVFVLVLARPLKESIEDLLQLVVAVLAKVNITVLCTMVEVAVHDPCLTVVADLVCAEGQPSGTVEVHRILASCLLLHFVPVRDDADTVSVSRQRVCHQRQESNQEHRGREDRAVPGRRTQRGTAARLVHADGQVTGDLVFGTRGVSGQVGGFCRDRSLD